MIQFFTIFTLLQGLLFASFTGTIIDNKTLKPIVGATISDSKSMVKSDINGWFHFRTKDKVFHIKSYGYKAQHIKTGSNIRKYKLEKINVKALYLSFWGASGNSTTMKRIFKIIDKTEVNAIVVDIKNEYGSTLYKTSFKQANSYGAHTNRTNRNIQRFMKMMKDRNIYTIARIVTFKDEIQASHNPEYAIKNAKGEIWRNHDDMAWVDPYDRRSHDYTIRLAEEAAKVGFDEINFDYIRFPAKSDLVYTQKNTQENRIQAISLFLDTAKKKLQKYGVYISVDTYGNILWTKEGDNNIGQTVESLAQHADYLAPMLYPSGFARGSFGKKNPSSYPFIVIYRSIKHIENIIKPIRVRPWLQYFRDYAHTKMYYKKHEIKEQIRASEKMNTNGWMMWSPSSKYHMNYFKATK